MANAFLHALMSLFTIIIGVLMTPLNTLLTTIVPDVSTAFMYVNDFFDLLGRYASFVVSYSGLYPDVIAIAIILYTAIITIPLAAHIFKLIAAWWETIV